MKGGDDENDSVIKEIRKNKNIKKNISNISKSITGILKKKEWIILWRLLKFKIMSDSEQSKS